MGSLAAAAVASAAMPDTEMIHTLLSDHPRKPLGLMQSSLDLAALTGHVKGMIHAARAASLEAPTQPV